MYAKKEKKSKMDGKRGNLSIFWEQIKKEAHYISLTAGQCGESTGRG
jgi:hypothetical protein